MAYKVSSGYTFCKCRDSRLPIDGLLVGQGNTIFQRTTKAFLKYSMKKQVAIKIISGKVYIYPLKIKLEKVVKIVNTIIR